MSWFPSRRIRHFRVFLLCAAALPTSLVLTGGCGRNVELGYDDEPASGGGPVAGSGGLSGGGGAQSGASTGGEAPCVPAKCRGKDYLCGNCIDDDSDGLVDSLDPDCLGPCDNKEDSLGTGLTSSAAACRQDCYFDGNNGAGNDKCEWSHACDPLSVAPDYPPSGEERCAYDPNSMGFDCAARADEQPAGCVDSCQALVPNGCDCFGCCELPGRSGNFYFVGGGSCELDALDDPSRCPPCTQVSSCRNTCEACEACVGTAPDASCGTDERCPSDSRACDADVPCDFGDYCVTGCCVRAPEPT